MARKYSPDFLYTYYKKHNGVKTDMSKDPDCPLRSVQQIMKYERENGWADRLNNEQQAFQENLIEKRREDLEKAKDVGVQLMKMAMNGMVGTITEEVDGKKVKKQVFVGDVGDLDKIICRFRTELGLPEHINGNAILLKKPNDNESNYTLDDVRNALHAIERFGDAGAELLGEGKGAE